MFREACSAALHSNLLSPLSEDLGGGRGRDNRSSARPSPGANTRLIFELKSFRSFVEGASIFPLLGAAGEGLFTGALRAADCQPASPFRRSSPLTAAFRQRRFQSGPVGGNKGLSGAGRTQTLQTRGPSSRSHHDPTGWRAAAGAGARARLQSAVCQRRRLIGRRPPRLF